MYIKDQPSGVYIFHFTPPPLGGKWGREKKDEKASGRKGGKGKRGKGKGKKKKNS